MAEARGPKGRSYAFTVACTAIFIPIGSWVIGDHSLASSFRREKD